MPDLDLPAGPTLVTGATGWLGRRLVSALVDGLPECAALATPPPRQEVRALVLPDDDASPVAARGVVCVPGDLTRPSSLRRFVDGARGGTLFHCAGVIHPKRASGFDAVNAAGTRALLEAAAEAGVRRVIHVSSNSPFGAGRDPRDRFDEQRAYRPYLGYGRSKMLAERAAWDAAARGGLEVVVVRVPWFYGPGQPERQTRFFSLVRRGWFPIPGDGTQLRSMAYVDDVCQGLLLAERTRSAAGEAFWIADARPYPLREIADTVARVLRDAGYTVATSSWRLPGWVSDVARVADRTLQFAGGYDARVHVLSELNLTIACSIDKARTRLGYAPTLELEEGMRRSVAWVHAQGGVIA